MAGRLTVSFTFRPLASQDLWLSDADTKAVQLNKRGAAPIK